MGFPWSCRAQLRLQPQTASPKSCLTEGSAKARGDLRLWRPAGGHGPAGGPGDRSFGQDRRTHKIDWAAPPPAPPLGLARVHKAAVRAESAAGVGTLVTPVGHREPQGRLGPALARATDSGGSWLRRCRSVARARQRAPSRRRRAWVPPRAALCSEQKGATVTWFAEGCWRAPNAALTGASPPLPFPLERRAPRLPPEPSSDRSPGAAGAVRPRVASTALGAPVFGGAGSASKLPASAPERPRARHRAKAAPR